MLIESVWEVKYNLLTNKYMRQTAAIGLIVGLVPELVPGLIPGLRFFLHRLNPGRVEVQKIDNPLLVGAKKMFCFQSYSDFS